MMMRPIHKLIPLLATAAGVLSAQTAPQPQNLADAQLATIK